MNLPQFEHLAPRSVQDTCVLLSRHGKEARIVAGGTDLLVKMKHRRLLPRYLINIKRIPDLDYVRYEPGEGLRIGALTTIESLKGSVVVRRKFPVLHQAVAYMATVEIRNRATIVGNICNGSPSSETAPSLIALGARARIVRDGGERIVPVEDFFTGPGRTILQPSELVAEIQIPKPLPRSAGVYEKHSLRRMDVAIVSVAAMVTLDGEICSDIRIVLGAVAPTPLIARKAADVLQGRKPSDDLIKQAAWTASEESRPISDIRGTGEFRRNMVGILTQQVIQQALREISPRVG